MTFGTTRLGRSYVAIAVDLVALPFGDVVSSHVGTSAAKIAVSSVFSDFQGRLGASHVADSRPRFSRGFRVRSEFSSASGTTLSVARSSRLGAVGLRARLLAAGRFSFAAFADAAFVFGIVEFGFVGERLSAENAGFPALALFQLGHAAFGVLQTDAQFRQRLRQVVHHRFQVLSNVNIRLKVCFFFLGNENLLVE